jgi:hypothetical protein
MLYEDGETIEAMKLAIEHNRPSKLLSEIEMPITNHINDYYLLMLYVIIGITRHCHNA